MKTWPEFNERGDLPPGIHAATIGEIRNYFGSSAARAVIASRLERIYDLVRSTGHLTRFIIFGSFITAKIEPNDIDIFLMRDDSFAVQEVSSEAHLVFDHAAAQNFLGASVFWVRRAAALGGEDAMVSHWQIKRHGGNRGIVEVI